jgi:hypothetical protein
VKKKERKKKGDRVIVTLQYDALSACLHTFKVGMSAQAQSCAHTCWSRGERWSADVSEEYCGPTGITRRPPGASSFSRDSGMASAAAPTCMAWKRLSGVVGSWSVQSSSPSDLKEEEINSQLPLINQLSMINRDLLLINYQLLNYQLSRLFSERSDSNTPGVKGELTVTMHGIASFTCSLHSL